MRACVRACVRVCVCVLVLRVCVRVCARVCSLLTFRIILTTMCGCAGVRLGGTVRDQVKTGTGTIHTV